MSDLANDPERSGVDPLGWFMDRLVVHLSEYIRQELAVSTETRRPQCRAMIYRKDTYRRTGRGPSGFEMHYNPGQCSRRAVQGSDLCEQHRDCGWNIQRIPDSRA